VARLRPDIILLDLDLGTESGLDLLPELLEAGEGARVLVVTALPDPELHLRAVRIGAMGVVLKTDSMDLLFKAIHKVYSGEAWLSKSMVSNVVMELHRRSTNKTDRETAKIASLTPREEEIVKLIGEGRRNKQIGERLFISEKTVRHYLTSIYDKLEVNDRLELMIYAYQHGLAKVSLPSTQIAKVRAAVPRQNKNKTASAQHG
jgi:DNA-binding NarL/FixJ family response regulator